MANKLVSRRCDNLSLIVLLASLFAFPCAATTDQTDLSVGMRTLPLLTNKIIGSATVAIVFDPANPTSREEASGIRAVFDSGFEAPGDLRLSGRLVPVNELAKLTGSKIAVLTSGLSAHYDAISAVADSSGILTMSTDLSCVQASKCVLGIVSKPHVEIYFSKAAADAAKISFGQVFTMLVKQL